MEMESNKIFTGIGAFIKYYLGKKVLEVTAEQMMEMERFETALINFLNKSLNFDRKRQYFMLKEKLDTLGAIRESNINKQNLIKNKIELKKAILRGGGKE